MTFLVFYDQRGQVQRVAIAPDEAVTQRYLDAGFVIVTPSEYNRAALLVPEISLDELPTLIAATALLAQIQKQQRQLASLRDVDTVALERLQSRLREEYKRITTDFTEGRITIEQWYRQMADLSNRANIAASALAVGGVNKLSAADLQAIERANETQLAYLNGFRRELETMSILAAIARAALYAGAITALFWTIFAQATGMPPLPAQPGVLTSCHTNCKCSWNILTLAGNGNWDCFWEVSAVEHCPECLRREQVFNPLQIRGGIIQVFNPIGIYTV